jgi:hypothetical protein
MKSSALILRANSSSISSSFDVSKITGRSTLPHLPQELQAIRARHLDAEDGEIGRAGLEAGKPTRRRIVMMR